MRYVLDSWAVEAVLRDEPAGPKVKPVIERGDGVISWINLGEVFYVESRRVGEPRAEQAVFELARLMTVDAPDGDLVLAAARIKARGGLSYADCFVIATAQRYGAPLLTGDPEIIRHGAHVEIVDLRTAA